ncbi:hypothetical protein J6590_087411 [Homalodisca vitripennis]|nr:hypothetical protein J6590_087411 [Homalodisca vitripennis]
MDVTGLCRAGTRPEGTKLLSASSPGSINNGTLRCAQACTPHRSVLAVAPPLALMCLTTLTGKGVLQGRNEESGSPGPQHFLPFMLTPHRSVLAVAPPLALMCLMTLTGKGVLQGRNEESGTPGPQHFLPFMLTPHRSVLAVAPPLALMCLTTLTGKGVLQGRNEESSAFFTFHAFCQLFPFSRLPHLLY